MMLIMMCDLKSFDDAATASQGQKHEVARLLEALWQRYDAAQELFSPDPGDGDVGTQLRCNRCTQPIRNASIRK
jgi:hypothetical protein